MENQQGTTPENQPEPTEAEKEAARQAAAEQRVASLRSRFHSEQ